MFQPGVSGNPKGRPVIAPVVKALAKAYTVHAVETLANLMLDKDETGQVRVAAAKELLDRGHGKAQQ